jgi:pimeloyl-ACP methyl ester carboxylesterase
MTTFMLVPGAWLGAWAWQDTAQALRAQGHTALPLTLTGLGEYAGRGTPETDLETHIADITGFVGRRDLRDITLVAHSYAGAPVTGAAGRLGDRLERVVYVDSAPFATGMCMLDLMPPEAADELRRQVAEHGDGWRLPMPPFAVLGLSSSLDGLDESKRELLRTRATPQPFGTYEQRLTGPAEPGPHVDPRPGRLQRLQEPAGRRGADAGGPQPAAVAAFRPVHGALAYAVGPSRARQRPRPAQLTGSPPRQTRSGFRP